MGCSPLRGLNPRDESLTIDPGFDSIVCCLRKGLDVLHGLFLSNATMSRYGIASSPFCGTGSDLSAWTQLVRPFTLHISSMATNNLSPGGGYYLSVWTSIEFHSAVITTSIPAIKPSTRSSFSSF